MITISIISHGHGEMLVGLVSSLLRFSEVRQIIITFNILENIVLPIDSRIHVVNNVAPKGFGMNHNAAFFLATQPFFCPLNPDVKIFENPFPALLDALIDKNFAIAAPLVVSQAGQVEDSIRRFPTLGLLLAKAFLGKDGRYSVSSGQVDFFPEWVAGMFMLFRGSCFAELGGFDERFYLYYEDVDICVRVWRSGLQIVACPSVFVVHDARRESHRRLRYLRWHLASMFRYFLKHWGRLPHVAN